VQLVISTKLRTTGRTKDNEKARIKDAGLAAESVLFSGLLGMFFAV